MSTSTTARHLEMLRKIPTNPSTPISTTKLHKHLVDEGFQVSKRTVERDLLKLSELGGLYSTLSVEGNTWCSIRNTNAHKSTMQPSEAFMLVLSEKLLFQSMPIEYSRRLDERIANAKSVLNSNDTLYKWQSKLQVISDGYPLINTNKIFAEDIREVIYECVLKEYQIDITYQAKDKVLANKYSLNPLGIIIRGQSHYLVATKLTSPEQPLLFLFHRIQSATNTYKEAELPSSFTMEDYYASNPSGWILNDRSEAETVQLKVKGFALDTLTHNQLAVDQELGSVTNGWTTVQFSIVLTYDLVAWILRYGADVICEAPEHLRNKVKNIINSTLEQYR
jgi:predicted DNA-binding transcriptional regulator YafY